MQVDRVFTQDVFYSPDTAEGRARQRSPETDFGVWWTELGGWPYWRISWVEATGEVYAVPTGSRGPALAIGRPEDMGSGPVVLVLGSERDKDLLEAKLEGWAEVCGTTKGTLAWVRERLTMAGRA